MNRRATIVTLAAAATLAGGCQMLSNDRLLIGAGDQSVELAMLADDPPLTEATGPSVTGADRSAWGTREFLAANDGVGHWTSGARVSPRFDEGTRRATGAYPTMSSCVELGGSPGAQVAELAAAPGFWVWDVVSYIPRAFRVRERVSPLRGDGYVRAGEGLE